MTIDEKAHHVAQMLIVRQGVPRVVAFDPALIVLLVSILTQLSKLLRWWKPEWFVSWQTDRIIKSHLRESRSGLSVRDVKRAISASDQRLPLDQISVL